MPEATHVIVARTQFAPAKINLALHVTGRRADGYHLIESLAVFTRFGDRIAIEPSERDEFSVSGRYAGDVPGDDSNLILKARDRLRAFCGPAGAAARKADRQAD